MRCAKCSFDNPQSARFCNQCGIVLVAQQTPQPSPKPEPQPGAHPAIAALINLIAFWRPVPDQGTADRLRNLGFVGAIALFVQSLRDVAMESAPHWTFAFVLAALVAALFLYRRWAVPATLTALGVAVLTVIDAQVSVSEGYSASALAIAARLVAALLLANGARGLRFGAASAGFTAPVMNQARAFFMGAAAAPQAKGFFSANTQRAPTQNQAQAQGGIDLILLAGLMQCASVAAALIDGAYWDVWGAAMLEALACAACAVAFVLFCSPIAAGAAVVMAIVLISGAGEASGGFLLTWLIGLGGAVLGLYLTLRNMLAARLAS